MLAEAETVAVAENVPSAETEADGEKDAIAVSVVVAEKEEDADELALELGDEEGVVVGCDVADADFDTNAEYDAAAVTDAEYDPTAD